MPSSPSFAQMRRRNSNVVVNLVKNQPGISRAELAKQAGLAKATISEIVDHLLRLGLLQESGSRTSSGGRPAVGLTFNASVGFVLGICLDPTGVAACLVDLDGSVLNVFRLARIDWTAAEIYSNLSGRLQAAFAELGCSKRSVLALGLAIPGPVAQEVKNKPDAAKGEYGQFIHSLKNDFDCAVQLDSNTNMAALAEVTRSTLCESDVVLVVRLGHMVRTAIVANNQILCGSGGLAGELGHIAIPNNRFKCSCGLVGCINTVASTGAILDRALRAGVKASTFDEVIAECKSANQEELTLIIAEAASAVGYGLAAAINLIAPDVVIVSGPAAQAGDLVLIPLREALRRSALSDNLNRCRLLLGPAGDTAECFGAALFALEKLTAEADSLIDIQHRRTVNLPH